MRPRQPLATRPGDDHDVTIASPDKISGCRIDS
jgi:hypothetical protein